MSHAGHTRRVGARDDARGTLATGRTARGDDADGREGGGGGTRAPPGTTKVAPQAPQTTSEPTGPWPVSTAARHVPHVTITPHLPAADRGPDPCGAS